MSHRFSRAIMVMPDELAIASGSSKCGSLRFDKRRSSYVYPDHIALLTVTRIAKTVGGSALPNAPVVDDSFDRPPVEQRLTAFRKRLAELIWPGELIVPAPAPSFTQDAALAGC
jgi:hypothetical protein